MQRCLPYPLPLQTPFHNEFLVGNQCTAESNQNETTPHTHRWDAALRPHKMADIEQNARSICVSLFGSAAAFTVK